MFQANAWTLAHGRWVRRWGTSLQDPALRMAFDTVYDTVLATSVRPHRLDIAIATMATDSPFTPGLRRPAYLHGVLRLTGVGLAVEVGDWHWFTGSTIVAHLGLAPLEGLIGIVTGARVNHQDRQLPRPPAAR